MKSLSEDQNSMELDNVQELPTVLFACNVSSSVYSEEQTQKCFENLFLKIGPANFVYLPSFRRIRIQYETPEQAAQARMTLDHTDINGERIELFFGHIANNDCANSSLLPPIEKKTFLISPPASPPVGWQPIEEGKPTFSFDLISALVEMAPGQSHELQKATSSTPSVVVHICEDTLDSEGQKIPQNRIQQTRRPGI